MVPVFAGFCSLLVSIEPFDSRWSDPPKRASTLLLEVPAIRGYLHPRIFALTDKRKKRVFLWDAPDFWNLPPVLGAEAGIGGAGSSRPGAVPKTATQKPLRKKHRTHEKHRPLFPHRTGFREPPG